MTPADIVRDIYDAAVEIHEPYSSLTAEQRATVDTLLARFEDAEAKHGTLPHADILRPMLLSKAGRYDDALALTDRRYRESPTWQTAVGAANAARRAGDMERSAAMFAVAADHDPNDVTCLLEIGDIRLEQDRWAEALTAYERALATEPRHQWAMPSAFYCRHRLGIEGEWLASLREVANQEGCTCGLQGCLTALLGVYGSDRGIERATYLLARMGETE